MVNNTNCILTRYNPCGLCMHIVCTGNGIYCSVKLLRCKPHDIVIILPTLPNILQFTTCSPEELFRRFVL